jgi:hypothetical protein
MFGLSSCPFYRFRALHAQYINRLSIGAGGGGDLGEDHAAAYKPLRSEGLSFEEAGALVAAYSKDGSGEVRVGSGGWGRRPDLSPSASITWLVHARFVPVCGE